MKVKTAIKSLLAQAGLTITRINHTSKGYIPAKATVSAAEKAGLSVCDYVERMWSNQGDTEKLVHRLATYGLFRDTTENPTVVEIGTGTGRYLEKVLARCHPARYESYEIAKDWSAWLRSRYPKVVSHEADGVSLKQTPDHSVDLLHAHGVFVYLPFLVSYGYWQEIWRVMKPGSTVVFDMCSEGCFDESAVERWLKSEHRYPCFLSKQYVVSLFEKHGFSLIASFMNRYGEGRSEYLVLTHKLQ